MSSAADDSLRHTVIPTTCADHAGISAIHAAVCGHCIYCGAERGKPVMGLAFGAGKQKSPPINNLHDQSNPSFGCSRRASKLFIQIVSLELFV